MGLAAVAGCRSIGDGVGQPSATSNAPTSRSQAAPGGGHGATATTEAARPDTAFVQPEQIESRNGVLEVTLRAAPATVGVGVARRAALAYNGTVPGPTLRARPGDRLRIRLENALDEPTNLHTHGLWVSPSGNSDNVFVTVAPGAVHTYEIDLPADHPPGTFWYHPHVHHNVAAQVHAGLAGAIVVDDGTPLAPTERVMLLADPAVGERLGTATRAMTMMGREGDVVLVNGEVQPAVAAPTGSLELWRIVNTSVSRFWRLQLDGHLFHHVGSDGGRFEGPVDVESLVLVPGERAEVLVQPIEPGRFALRAWSVDRGSMPMGAMGGMGGMGGMAGAVVDGKPVAWVEASPGTGTVALPTATGSPRAAPSPARTREVRFDMAMGPGGARFEIDGRQFDPGRVDVTVAAGTTEEWLIRNPSTMDHPFHLHVWPFRVLERSDGVVPPGWKDVVDVPANGWVRLLIPFERFTGRTVFHCHVLDHEDLGMMAVIEVA